MPMGLILKTPHLSLQGIRFVAIQVSLSFRVNRASMVEPTVSFSLMAEKEVVIGRIGHLHAGKDQRHLLSFQRMDQFRTYQNDQFGFCSRCVVGSKQISKHR
jgi:hypothetical protein